MKTIKFNKLSFLIIGLLLSIISCKKEDAGLTKATQSGANTFSCKVDGKNFFPKQDLFGPKPLVVYTGKFQGNTSLYLSAHQYDHRLRDISFHVNDFKGVGVYYFKEPVKTVNSYGYTILNLPDVYVQLGLAYPESGERYANDGQITITRYDSGIVSGTFEFTFLNGSELIKVTYGRFDLKL
jgi:hypothetical protein